TRGVSNPQRRLPLSLSGESSMLLPCGEGDIFAALTLAPLCAGRRHNDLVPLRSSGESSAENPPVRNWDSSAALLLPLPGPLPPALTHCNRPSGHGEHSEN